jgi:hypothetical protein
MRHGLLFVTSILIVVNLVRSYEVANSEMVKEKRPNAVIPPRRGNARYPYDT